MMSSPKQIRAWRLNIFSKTHIDLLLVDIRMPEVDGFDVISRAQMVQPDVAVLVMTGFGTVETAIRALRQGVDGLLLKPFNKSEELLQAVRQALTDNQRKRDTARVSGAASALQCHGNALC